MALTLEQIFAPFSLAESKQFCIDVLVSVGFSGAASWQDGSLARTLGIEVPARVMVNLRSLIVAYAKGGYNDTALGDWLTIFSASHYDNWRHVPVKTQGLVLLRSGDMAHSISPGELVVADEVEHRTFRNTEQITLSANSAVPAQVEAEVAGSDSNVPAGLITIVQTTHAGLTVTNPGVIEGDWITQAGADQERDPALQTRNRTKWATKAYATPAAGYENYAREADPAITRVFVDDQNPMGPGSVRIVIAGTDGPSSPDSAVAVEDYIEGRTDGICRRPLCSELDCVPATPVDLTVTLTVYINPAYQDSAAAKVSEALREFFSTVPIGGVKTSTEPATPPPVGYVFFSQLYLAVMQVPGVVNAVFTAPTADVPVALYDVVMEHVALTATVIS